MFICNCLQKIFRHQTVTPVSDGREDVVEESERIVRFLLSPLHFKNGELRSNAFNPTQNSEDISVNRLELLPIEQTKPIEKKMAANNPNHHYVGFALHTKGSAMSCGAKDVIPEPLEDNEAHAEMKLGIVRVGQDISPELQAIKDELTDKCKLLMDPDPNNDGWNGEEPIYP